MLGQLALLREVLENPSAQRFSQPENTSPKRRGAPVYLPILPWVMGRNDYTIASGTSWSCAIVTAIVAMMLQVKCDLTPAEIKRTLLDTARPIGPPERHVGRLIDAYSAIKTLVLGTTKPASKHLSALNWGSTADNS